MSSRDDDNNQPRQGEDPDAGLFKDFDDEEGFDDLDRDSDFASVYTDIDDYEEDLEAGSPEAGYPEAGLPEADETDWDETGPPDEEPDLWHSSNHTPGAFDDEPPASNSALPPLTMPPSNQDTLPPTAAVAEAEEVWEQFEDDEDFADEDSGGSPISLAMIVIAIVALGLLAAGGYGVVKQRAGMQSEIRELQAKLATAAPPQEVAAARQSAQLAAERSSELEQQVQDLQRENRNLLAIVSGLENQLRSQQELIDKVRSAPAPQLVAKPEAKQKTETAAAPAAAEATPASRAASVSGDWFVNFSSYSQRSTAEQWAQRLQTDKGRVIVAAGDSNGRTVYRVRIVDLPDKASAQAIARSLEARYGLSRLWVGSSR